MRALKWLLALVTILGLAAASLFVSLSQPYAAFDKTVFVTFERGTESRGMAMMLESAGVIQHSWHFLAARALNPGAKLQAGEYHFDTAASPLDVFRRISRGDVYRFEFTAPEGSNMFDIANLLDTQGILPGEDFLKAAGDASLIRDLAPKAKTLEGYLFPSTYQMTHATTARDLVKAMTQEFRKHWKQLSGGADAHSMVTLASLIEKETGSPNERALVASVFANRLDRGMKLECDPTTIYAALLDHRYKGKIHRSDLDSGNPYNTYRHEGLPPGPIANPGAASLAAALHPAETKYIFFVAKPGGGGHHFSATLAEHSRAVAEYRAGVTHAKAANRH